jgi:hypothetical protein
METEVRDLMPSVLARLGHDLTSKLTCVNLFLEVRNYESALRASNEAIHILSVFRQGIAIRGYELEARRAS